MTDNSCCFCSLIKLKGVFIDLLASLLPHSQVHLVLLRLKACFFKPVSLFFCASQIRWQHTHTQKKNAASKCYLQFFSKAREHVGDALVDGSRLLKQQETFRSCSKVQQVVQQRLLPHHPIRKTHSVS